MEVIKYKGILCRNTFMDKWIVDEMDNRFDADYSYILQNVQGKTVLDIGANIGAFARRALDAGAAKVITVEPNKDNFALLQSNTDDYENVMLYENAVTMQDNDTVVLYVNNGSNKGLHSIMLDSQVVRKGNYEEVAVTTISIDTLLDTYKPQVLKIDIEGAEELLKDRLQNLPNYVEYIAIEFDTDTNYICTLGKLAVAFTDKQSNKFFTGKRN